MRKLFILAAAVMATAGTTAIPMTAQAAVNTYTLPGGNGRAVVISGSGLGDLSQVLGQIGGNWNSVNCNNGFWGDQILDIDPDFSVPGVPDEEKTDSGQSGNIEDSMAAQVVKLVNEERTKAGLSPLTVDRTVTAAAQKRAREIETSFSHTRPNGSGFSTALTEAGVNYRGAGENIAYGQNSAAQVMQGWMNSAGHRANILNGNFTTIGVGHYKSASGVDYWTQLFTN